MKSQLTQRKRSWGFTLIELLVAALAGAILLAATAGIVVQVLRIDREETGRLEVQSDQSLLVDFISRDLSEAVFIYNDTFNAALPATDPQRFNTPDGIPDLNQLLLDPGWIGRRENRIPVVAFWKYEPIDPSCFVSTIPPNDPATLEEIAAGQARIRNQPPLVTGPDPDLSITDQDWLTITSRRTALNLVVYFLRREYNGAGNPTFNTAEGNALIEKATYTQFNITQADGCTRKNPFYLFEPDPFNSTFLEWPDPLRQAVAATAQVPATGALLDAATISLSGNIHSTRAGALFTVQPDPVNAPVAVDPVRCSRYGLDPFGLPLYTLGGVKPAPPPTTFPDVPVGEADRGFYVCVRRTANANQPQDAIVNITTNALQRASPGLFNRYIRDATSIDPDTLSSYLNTVETRVLSRGALSRAVS